MLSEIRKGENAKLITSELRARGGNCFLCGQPVADAVWYHVRGPLIDTISNLMLRAGSAALIRELGKCEPAHAGCRNDQLRDANDPAQKVAA